MEHFALLKVTPTDFSHSASVLASMKKKGEPSGLPLCHHRPNMAVDKYRLDLFSSKSAFVDLRLMAKALYRCVFIYSWSIFYLPPLCPRWKDVNIFPFYFIFFYIFNENSKQFQSRLIFNCYPQFSCAILVFFPFIFSDYYTQRFLGRLCYNFNTRPDLWDDMKEMTSQSSDHQVCWYWSGSSINTSQQIFCYLLPFWIPTSAVVCNLPHRNPAGVFHSTGFGMNAMCLKLKTETVFTRPQT